MQPHKKKVVIMAAVSLGIVSFAYILPVVIVPMYISVSQSACTGYDCAQNAYARCSVYQTSEGSGFLDSMSGGMNGMLCMMGLDGGAKAVIYVKPALSHVTFN
jgi:hypothetical protein